ncbi:MAG: hypothetical protein HQ568_08385 [Calditrichaeota bacterium]|nr:hypothetical protein [Calditrichota bacterium]
MSNKAQSYSAFKSIVAAKKKIPKVGAPHRILILNRQGLPIMQMSKIDDFAVTVDDKECGEVAELARKVYKNIESFRGLKPERVAFFYKDEVITVEIDGPFIFLMIWSEKAFKRNAGIENFLKRLKSTLNKELN